MVPRSFAETTPDLAGARRRLHRPPLESRFRKSRRAGRRASRDAPCERPLRADRRAAECRRAPRRTVADRDSARSRDGGGSGSRRAALRGQRTSRE
jgi:hypothetical protein